MGEQEGGCRVTLSCCRCTNHSHKSILMGMIEERVPSELKKIMVEK